MKISACLIVKDEESHLEACLYSIKDFVDEIIVVDTGSKDSTKKIAEKFTSNIYDFKWVDDFSKARNFSISKAASEWILVIDADEILEKESLKRIKNLIDQDEYDAFALEQRNYTNNRTEFNFIPSNARNFQGYIPCNIIRLFRNNKKILFSNPVHESVDESIKNNNLKVLKTNIPLHHFQDEKGNLKEKQIEYMRICEKNIDSMPNKAKAHRDIAIIASNFLKDDAKAIKHFKESLNYNEKNLKTYIGLGWAYINNKQFLEAEKIFFKALKYYPNNATLHASIGASCEKQNKLKRALTAYNNAKLLGYPETAQLEIIISRIKAQLNNTHTFKVNYSP
jgi:glycosyltransferase involved in cell wall biosynthesis